jgi:hypothetical protein
LGNGFLQWQGWKKLAAGTSVPGVTGDAIATVVNINWYGSNCVDVVYKIADGRVASGPDGSTPGAVLIY